MFSKICLRSHISDSRHLSVVKLYTPKNGSSQCRSDKQIHLLLFASHVDSSLWLCVVETQDGPLKETDSKDNLRAAPKQNPQKCQQNQIVEKG